MPRRLGEFPGYIDWRLGSGAGEGDIDGASARSRHLELILQTPARYEVSLDCEQDCRRQVMEGKVMRWWMIFNKQYWG